MVNDYLNDSLKEFFWRNGMKYLIGSAFLITLYTLNYTTEHWTHLTCVQHWFPSGETGPPYKINYLSKRFIFNYFTQMNKLCSFKFVPKNSTQCIYLFYLCSSSYSTLLLWIMYHPSNPVIYLQCLIKPRSNVFRQWI